jgi:hypothetical protein
MHIWWEGSIGSRETGVVKKNCKKGEMTKNWEMGG